MKCQIIDFETVDWEFLDQFDDRTVFQTREWLRFVSKAQNAIPVAAESRKNGKLAGYFSGLTFTRFGVKSSGLHVHRLQPASWQLACCCAGGCGANGVARPPMHMEISNPYFAVEDGQELGLHSQG